MDANLAQRVAWSHGRFRKIASTSRFAWCVSKRANGYYGDPVGPFGLKLTGNVSGDVATGGDTVLAGGQFVAERVD
jgi:hypothetical protein